MKEQRKADKLGLQEKNHENHLGQAPLCGLGTGAVLRRLPYFVPAPLSFGFSLLPSFWIGKAMTGGIFFVCCCPLRQEAVGSRFCGLELLSFASERKREKTSIVDVLWFMPMQYSTKTEVAEILSDYQKSANKTRRAFG